MGVRARTDFTENLEAVSRGVRRLDEIRDPILREAVVAALRLRDREPRLDPAGRARMRRTVLASVAPRAPRLSDRVYAACAILAKPAPLLVRGLVVAVVVAGLVAGATVASADSLPDEPFYALKVAGEQVRLAIAASPEDRATVRLSIAGHRLDEAERLAEAGRADEAIIATANYGESLANAAAELASVETLDPRTAALVEQMQASLTVGQQRIAATAARLATDPRTAATAAVLETVSATAAPGKRSEATRIADQAAAVTSRLSAVADERARQADRPRTEGPRPTEPRVAPGGARATETPEAPRIVTPRGTANPNRSEASPVPHATGATPPPDPNAAHQAAEHAKRAAEEAKRSAEKAKRAASRTPTPDPTGPLGPPDDE
ncbi:MAG TPA: DUF5667 domain-containing protein [Candidatus Limnocylindria bacterium]|nr:DUF5667 domain-containing protein [Candidatus Limnocylindria bacterium]